MKNNILNINSITFGKYRGKTLDVMLKDRDYCKWLVNEEWFQTNYEYLYNRVSEYNPITYFIPENTIEKENFIDNYTYFNLKSIDEIDNEGLISLTDIEKRARDLDSNEYVPVVAIQSVDREHAVEAMDTVRELMARYGG
jgi:hypothetical protein